MSNKEQEIKEVLKPDQTFTGFMREFLKTNSVDTLVEVGSDVQLRVALHLSDSCKKVISVNFKEDHDRSSGWYDLHQDHGCYNLELRSGNAMDLSKIVPKADVVLLHNVLLDPTGTDTALLWKYRRNEVEYTDDDWDKLVEKFRKAEVDGYREFLKVANPGYVISFNRKESEGSQDKLLTEKLGIDKSKITKVQLKYDEEDKDQWILHIVDNTHTS